MKGVKELAFLNEFGPVIFKLHFVGQESHDHIDHDTHERPQSVFVIWLSDDVEADWIRLVHQVPDPKIRPAGVLGDSRIPVKVQKSLRRR